MKHIFILVSLFTLTFISFAQQPEWAWGNGGGGTLLDYGTSISVDAERNLYLAGWFNSDTVSFGSTVLANNGIGGTSDIFIAKYDPLGLLLWVKNFGGSGDDRCISIKANSKGDIVLAGWFNSPSVAFGNIALKNEGSNDVFVAQLTRDAIVLWAKSTGGNANDEGTSISCDTKDNIYVTGMYNSPALSFGSTTLTNSGKNDIYLACYDNSGKLVWAKNIGGENDDSGSTVTTDSNNDIYLTGKFKSAEINLGGKSLPNSGKDENYGDIFIAKYNSSGKLAWGKSLGGSYYDEVYSITADMWNNVYLTGWFKSDTIVFGCDTLMECTILTRANGAEYGDVFIAKYDTDGKPVWAKRAGGMARDYGFGITSDAVGDVYLTGVFESNFISFGHVNLKNATSNDIFISKYDSAGKVIWAKSIYGFAMSRCITTDLNGDVYLAGVYHSPEMRFGTTLLKNAGNGDVFVAKLRKQ